MFATTCLLPTTRRASPQYPPALCQPLAGQMPCPDWKRPPGRPRKTWIQQVEEDHRCTIDSQDRSLWRSPWPSLVKRSSGWVSMFSCMFLYKNTFCRSRSLSNATFSFLITSRSSSSKFAVLYKILWKSDDFCRAMLCKRGLCRHAVSVCLSVCPSLTCVSCVKANKHIVIFLPSGIQATVSNGIAIFRREPPWQGGGRMQVG